MYDFLALNRLRGFSPRQQRLLELEAVYLGTQYKGLPAWSEDFGPGPDGRTVALCGTDKEPTLKAGVIEEKVGTLADLLVGEGRFPTLKLGDGEGDEPHPLVEVLEEQVRIEEASYSPAVNLLVKGSGAMGFAVLESGRVEALELEPEWCEPVFVCKVGSERAEQLAEELAEAGVALRAPRRAGDYLWTPDDAPGRELAFLRHEYVYHDEAAYQDLGPSAGDVMMRVRTDYTPDAVVVYEPRKVYSETERAGEWVVREVRYHNLGFLPIEWARSRGAKAGEPEGPSLIGESLRSIAEAADRALTRKDESVGVVSNPKAYTIDLQDLVADYNAESGMPTNWLARSSEVMHFRSIGQGKTGTIAILEPTGKGPEAAKAHLDDLMAHAARVSRVLAHDPQKAAEVQSGVQLERMMQPTIAVVNAMRRPLAELLKGFIRKLALATGHGDVKVEVQWPPVVAKTSADLAATADALTKATGGSAVVSQETATRLFATAAEIEDPDAEAAAVKAGAEEAMDRARAALSAAPAEPDPKKEPTDGG